MYYGLTHIENNFALKLIHLVAQCLKITNTVLFLKCILDLFSAFLLISTSDVRMSEGTFCPVEV